MRKGKILIVDNDPELLYVLQDNLVEKGWEVSTCEDGGRALSLLERERPELVLLDLRLPGADGLSVLREISELEPQVAVIVMTGDASPAKAKQALDAGACDFVLKPIDLDYLEESMEANVLIRRRATA